jgi:hypothetical protein
MYKVNSTIFKEFLLIIVLLFPTCNLFCEDAGKIENKSENLTSKSCPPGMIEIPTHYMKIYPVFFPVNGEEIQLGAFCIDEYEYPNIKGSFPKVDVTFTQAEESCKEKGKRLCSYYEWQTACMGSKSYKYPYGLVYESNKCNTRRGITYLESKSSLARSGEFPECKSDFGPYDMVGNVWEWTKNYESGKDTSSLLMRELRGGSWESGYSCFDTWKVFTKLDLPDTFEVREYDLLDKVGFRCCKSLDK